MRGEGMAGPVFEDRLREAATAATMLAAPEDAWERIAARVRDGEVVLLPVEDTRRRTTVFTTRGLRVAGMLLLVGGAAAAAVLPASPVRQWLAKVFNANRATDLRPPAVVVPDSTAPSPRPPLETTLVLEPANGEIVLALEAPEQDVSLVVRFVERGEPELRATGAAASAQFRSAAGRLSVASATGGVLVLTIPRTTTRVRVEVDGKAYLTKENGRIHVLAPAADTAGSEILLHIRR
jgi:hypothetical protein